MAKRYIGDAVVTIKYRDQGDYAGTIKAGGHTWRFSELRPAPAGFGPGIGYDSPEAYDEMAKSAVSFGSYYSSSNRGDDTPDWAPDPETADAIDEAVSWAQDDRGEYEVRRSEKGAARETAEARKDQRREQSTGSFVVVLWTGQEGRFHDMPRARAWAEERLKGQQPGAYAAFYRAAVAHGRQDTGAPWTVPFYVEIVDEYGRIRQADRTNWPDITSRSEMFPHRASEPKRNTPHRDHADERAATELVMFIENTSDLSPDGPSGQGRSVLLNALRKWRKGTYDPELAVKLFGYLADAGAKRYQKEFGSDAPIFNPATRHEAARQLEAAFRSSAESGEYDHVDTRIGGARETSSHRVSDFNNISDLVQHAFDEGATHIRITDNDTFLYYPRGREFEEARVYSKNGYLHVPAHGARKIIQRLPSGGTWTKAEYRQRLPGRKGRRRARTNESPRRSAHNPVSR